MRYFFSIISCFLLFSSNGQSIDKEVQNIVEEFRTSYKIPAVAVAVIGSESIKYGLSGNRKIDQLNLIELTSKFHIGSNTKAITATLAAVMVEKEQISWTDKLVDVIPELKDQINKDYDEITLQDLLSHRAKLPAFEDSASSEWKNIPNTIATSKNQKLAFAQYALQLDKVKTSKNNAYSNAGTIIAALMLERKSGKSWDALLDNLFRQLEIDHHVGFPNQLDKKDTYGHKRKVLSFLSTKKYRSVEPEDEFEVMDYFSPAGNCSINIEDYSKFIQFHLKGLMGEDNFLKSASYQFMHFGLDYYSMGWYNGNIGKTDQKFSYHGGSLGTYSSMVMLSADRKIAIIILVNADDKNVNEFKTKLREKLWDQFGEK